GECFSARPPRSRRLSYVSVDGTGAPRRPHSFPTRRSSDLARRLLRRGQRGGPQHRRAPGRARGPRAAREHDRRLHLGQRILLRADRKSTRLNSSHVSISYAVFCLKKKTNESKDLPRHTPVI